MQDSFVVNAEERTDLGKGASRRLRRAKLVPGIVYGAGKDPQAISLSTNELDQHLNNEAFYSHVLNLKLGGKSQKVIIKDLQRHPFKPTVLHIDFLRVSAKQKLQTNVPLHFLNEDSAPAVKEGGVVGRIMNEVEISCLPKDLPEYIEVDLAGLALGESIHLSELQLPEGVELVAFMQEDAPDQTVVTINVPRAVVEEEPEAEGEEAEGIEARGEEAEGEEAEGEGEDEGKED
jgi:large subunit ribosomal protein L25